MSQINVLSPSDWFCVKKYVLYGLLRDRFIFNYYTNCVAFMYLILALNSILYNYSSNVYFSSTYCDYIKL